MTSKSKTAKYERWLKDRRCPSCDRKGWMIPRFPGARFHAFRCLACGATGRYKKGKK